MKKLLSLLLLLIITNFGNLICQTQKFFSTDNGLSNSLINQIYQDKRGFVWIATEYGLNRFDGVQFKIYKHENGNPSSLCHNYVRTLFEDSSGRFYVGTINGLMEYDWATDSFDEIAMYKDKKQVYTHITSFVELRTGEILLTTSGQGVFICKKGNNFFVYEPDLGNTLNSIYLNFIYEDSKSRIWIGSENDGLNCYDPITKNTQIFTAPTKISSNNISALVEDKEGNIYVGTLTKGLNILKADSDVFEHIPYSDGGRLFIKSLLFDENNRLLIGTDGQGLKVYNKENKRIEGVSISSVLFNFENGKIHSIITDREKNIWIGYFQKGVYLIPTTENKFDYFGYKSVNRNIIGSNSVSAIYKDKTGKIWIGTDNDGIYGINDKGEKLSHYRKTKSTNSAPDIIHSIFEDSWGNMWIGSYTDGLAKFNKNTGYCDYIPDFSTKKVYCITQDKEQNILVGTYGAGFYILDKNGNITEHYESSKREMDLLSVDELSNDWINSMMCDKDGLIWIGHFKGLSCFNPKEKTFLTYHSRNNILPKTVVQYLFEDKNGIIWIGTSSGLYSFNKKDEKIQSYTTKDGLSNDVICGITNDNENNLWISTYQGISKFKPDEKKFINYYMSNGLQGNEFSRGAVYKDETGKIFFGGINGVNSFYPEKIIDEKKVLNIALTNFYLFNTPIKKGDKSGGNNIIEESALDADKFTLSHDDNTFSFEFSTFDYTNPEHISFQYLMKGLNDKWITTPRGVYRITYNNIPPGKYQFQVRAHEDDNYSRIKTIDIVITPPWYKSVWAYLFYVLLFALLIYFIASFILSKIRHKSELMEKEQAEKISEAKLQFFINISHEIRTPMTLIINPLEKLITDNKNLDADKQKIYLIIYRNAQRILRLINQLMDIRKLDKGQMKLSCRETDIVGFIGDLMLTFEYLARKKNINFIFEHQNDKLMVWIDLNNFDKVLLNILSNAFKYTPDNGEIKIELSTGHDPTEKGFLHDYFEIIVSDTGIGIDKDQIENIFERFYQINNADTNSNFGTGIGLHLSRSLVKLHQGIIYAENRTDLTGSRFIIRLPMGNSHLDASQLQTPGLVNLNSETQPEQKQISVSINELENSAVETSESNHPKSKTNYKILIVEDEEEIRQYMKSELSSDYKVQCCSNGKEAFEIILKNKPDLIISDVMMPEMDGITLSRKIKKNINVNHIPIILLTAKSKTEDQLEGLEIGADAYIVKPFNTEILKQTINNLIANRERIVGRFKEGQQQSDAKIEKIELKSSDEILIEKIMKVVNENISNPQLNVEMLADNVGMSRVHMHRKLKELTNQSARDFIKNIRLKQAAMLLSEKKLSVSEVAYATGFSNLSHFSNSFKEFHGVSPTEYINSNSSI